MLCVDDRLFFVYVDCREARPSRCAARRPDAPSAIIGARLVLTSSAVGFMRARSSAVMMPRVSRLPGRCRLSTSACSKNASRLAATSKPSALARAVEPSRPQHTTCMPNARPTRATAAPIWPKAYTPRVRPNRRVPTVVCQWPCLRLLHFIGQMAQGGEYQAPRELGSGGIGAATPAAATGGDHNTVLGAGGDIEVVRVAPRLTDELEPGQALDDLTRQRHALLREQLTRRTPRLARSHAAGSV